MTPAEVIAWAQRIGITMIRSGHCIDAETRIPDGMDYRAWEAERKRWKAAFNECWQGILELLPDTEAPYEWPKPQWEAPAFHICPNPRKVLASHIIPGIPLLKAIERLCGIIREWKTPAFYIRIDPHKLVARCTIPGIPFLEVIETVCGINRLSPDFEGYYQNPGGQEDLFGFDDVPIPQKRRLSHETPSRQSPRPHSPHPRKRPAT